MGRYTDRQQLTRFALEALRNPGQALPAMPDGFKVRQPNGKMSTWEREYLKFQRFIETGQPQWKVFAKGNGKLPFFAWSVLPGFTCPGAGECLVLARVSDDKASPKLVNGWCYSFKAWRYAAPFFRQLQNTILLRSQAGRAHMVQAWQALPLNVDFRLLVDGDITDLDEMRFYWQLLEMRPDVRVYGYSKSWPVFLAWEKLGRSFPANYLLNLSSGSKFGPNMEAKMREIVNVDGLPIVRDSFLALPVSHKMPDHKLPEFQVWAAELRATAKARGLGNVWVCPGKCGECTPKGHACGSRAFEGIPVVIGIHAPGW